MAIANLEVRVMLEHVKDGDGVIPGQFLEVVRMDRHLPFADRLGEGDHAIVGHGITSL